MNVQKEHYVLLENTRFNKMLSIRREITISGLTPNIISPAKTDVGLLPPISNFGIRKQTFLQPRKKHKVLPLLKLSKKDIVYSPSFNVNEFDGHRKGSRYMKHYYDLNTNELIYYASIPARQATIRQIFLAFSPKGVIEPLLRFRSAVRTMMVILRASRNSSSEGKRSEEKILSLVHYQDEILNSRRCNYGDGLSFDPMQYRAVKEVTVSNEAKAILSMDSSDRTEEQLHVALLSLQTTVDSFCEFPIKMQQSLVERGWYEHFENKRVIIRQGHTAANFYMILSGEAVVTVVESASDTKQTTVAVLDKGNTFGELAIMHGARRSATVTCKGDVELLAVAREDFVDIFMHVDKEREPEHIAYLRTIDVLQKWPIERLPWDDPKICLFTYFRRGTVMCRDLEKSEWIYVIKTGSCRVLTTLRSTKPQIPRKHNTASKILSDTGSFTSSSESIYSIFSNSTVKSSKSEPKPRNRIKKVRFMDPNSNSTSIDSLSTESRLGHGLSRGMHTSLHKLPTLRKNKTFTDEELMTRHQLHLDTIAQEVTALRLKQGQPLHNLTSNDPEQDDLFVQLQTLGPTETFGLEPLAFHSDKCGKRVSLVSDGAEAILISRKFFCLHAPDQYYRKLRATIRQYPTCESLQQKLQIQANWDAFKKQSFCVHKSSSNRPQHVAQISSKVK